MQGFTKKYHVDRLVYYEVCPDILSAMTREKKIKVRHEVAIQTVAADSHLHATYCSVSSSLPEQRS